MCVRNCAFCRHVLASWTTGNTNKKMTMMIHRVNRRCIVTIVEHHAVATVMTTTTSDGCVNAVW